jgi:NAD(P)-dependent dehydrogenase (short-subunit alcohol dehydrogenase family)
VRRFEGKVALVSGAASGIGRAAARRLAQEGARLLCLDVQGQAVAELGKELRELGAEVEARACDVSDPAQVRAAVEACVERFGRLDCLVHMAGILHMGHFAELDLATWNRVLAVNLTSTFLICQAALPHLERSGGNVVTAASTASMAGLPYGAAYAASKGGVQALTRALAVEYGKRGVRVNAVCPGSIQTPMTRRPALPADASMDLIRRQMPLDRPRGPEVVAGLIALLASEDGAHINGEEIRVDGGTLA